MGRLFPRPSRSFTRAMEFPKAAFRKAVARSLSGDFSLNSVGRFNPACFCRPYLGAAADWPTFVPLRPSTRPVQSSRVPTNSVAVPRSTRISRSAVSSRGSPPRPRRHRGMLLAFAHSRATSGSHRGQRADPRRQLFRTLPDHSANRVFGIAKQLVNSRCVADRRAAREIHRDQRGQKPLRIGKERTAPHGAGRSRSVKIRESLLV